MSISDQDWDLLNAYADEELSATDILTVKARIAREPELREALSQIQEMKRHIKADHTLFQQENVAPTTQRKWARYGAAAAICLMISSGVYGWGLYDQYTQTNPEKIHQAYSEKGYLLEETPKAVQVSSQITGDFKIPDLSASELRLAEANLTYVDGKEVIVAHYRGMRGCRLTFVSIENDGEPLKASLDVNLSPAGSLLEGKWQSRHSKVTVIASGMDRQRFAAIAQFMKHEMDNQDLKKQEELRIAMETTYKEALPCA